MKAKDKFLVEATKQFGENAVITKSQVQEILKVWVLWDLVMVIWFRFMLVVTKVKLQPVDVSKTDVAVVTKKEVVKEVVLRNISRQRNG